ncbi:phosphoglycerate mutase-like protein 4 isoform X2 [Mangifera indica]|uniref:phosphoglycerate mutase-like protein 4 isoform X2 n=1 Tax=Mangifera indica TaxID=29780 RepID=UPI001CFC3822|nr:phosphoglycerate mutase-like protein 4 isoform X2 [Mangifera indica]
MSVLHTCSGVKPPRHSSLSSSESVNIPLGISFPTTKIILLHNGKTASTTHNLISTRFLTRRVKMAESLPLVISPSGSSSVDPAYCEIIVGHLDVELNDVGREQAVAVADRLAKEFKISVVYSSDLNRALETARTIAKTCGGLEVIEDQDLRERHLGDLQGLVFSEAAKICPDAHKALASQRTDMEIPGGGESLDQLYKRCTTALQRIGRKHKGQRVAVVTHGGVIRALYKRACPNDKSGGKVLNTSVNIFQLSDAKKWILKTWGDVSHLSQTGVLLTGFGGNRTSG